MNYSDRMKRVDDVVLELGLLKCPKTVIGNPERAVKGVPGEKTVSFYIRGWTKIYIFHTSISGFITWFFISRS